MALSILSLCTFCVPLSVRRSMPSLTAHRARRAASCARRLGRTRPRSVLFVVVDVRSKRSPMALLINYEVSVIYLGNGQAQRYEFSSARSLTTSTSHSHPSWSAPSRIKVRHPRRGGVAWEMQATLMSSCKMVSIIRLCSRNETLPVVRSRAVPERLTSSHGWRHQHSPWQNHCAAE